MGVRRAVLYGTVNGVCNNTNGLGRGRGGGQRMMPTGWPISHHLCGL